MPFVSPEDGYLTVLNLFRTDAPEKQDRLLEEMCAIVNTAAFPGWISSTVHAGQDKHGTANFIQWRGADDLEARYRGDEFKHHTVPVFSQIATAVKLLQNEVAHSQRHPSLGDSTEISPDRDDYTVIEILGVAPENQDEMIATAAAAHDWLIDVPGYRSQTILRGKRARSIDGTTGLEGELSADNSFVVVYSQWDSKEAYDAYRAVPADEQPAARRESQAKRDSITTHSEWNTYRVYHTRSAAPASV